MSCEEFNKTMMDVSPFLVSKVIENIAGKVNQVKMLKDQSLLIEAKDLKQANTIIQIISLNENTKVKVTEDSKFNSSKGVIYAPQLLCVSDEQLLIDLEDQFITEIKRLETTKDGRKKANGIFFVTFSVPEAPKNVKAAYLSLEVRPFVPKPTQCFGCGKFGHVSKYCKAEIKPCMNCTSINHSDTKEVKCNQQPRCINCNETHHTLNRSQCRRYKEEAAIIRIKITEKIPHREAVERVKGRPNLAQRLSYARTVGSTPPEAAPSSLTPVNASNCQTNSIKNNGTNIIKQLLIQKKSILDPEPSTSKKQKPNQDENDYQMVE